MKKVLSFQPRKSNCLIFSFLLMVMMMAGISPAMAQNHYTAADFRWEYASDSSTCENNGRLIYIVINKVTGDTLDFNGGVCMMPDGTRFELGSFQFRSEGSTEAFMSTSSSTTTASFAPGVYEVKWSAQMYNVGESVPVAIGIDTTDLVEVKNAYHPSILNLVGQSTAESSVMYGGRPSLPGQSTGRIQFQVSNANFPLHFTITDSENETVFETVMNGPMYSGNDAHRYDFATYYTFDSLAAGNYSLLMEDGCGRSNPSYAFDIREVRAPILTEIHFNNDPPTYRDSNVVHFYSARLSVDADVWDYLYGAYQGYLQYRVCYGDIDTSNWKPFPIDLNQLTRNSDYSYTTNYHIYDTARNMSSYCPLYGKYLTFQYRCTIPGQEDTVTRYTYILEKHQPYIHTYDSISYNQNEVVYNACTYHIPAVHEYTARNSYSYTGSWYSYMPPVETSSNTNVHYFTAPYKWQMIDTVRGEVVLERSANYWDSWNIYKSDMEALYGRISDTVIKFPVKIVLTDAKNCPMVTYPDITMYDHTTSVDASRSVHCEYSQWIDEYSTGYDIYRCCQAPTGLRIYERIYNGTFGNNESGLLAMPDPNRFKYMRDGMQIKVTRSPYENKYNFTATYSFDRNEWDVVWENEDHGDVVTSVYESNETWNYYFGIKVEENCFPYGDYEWEFITDCNTESGTYRYPYGKEVIERTEDLSFTAEQNCMEMYIQLTGGQFSRVKLGADVSDPMQADEVWLSNPYTLNTYVKVLGDSTGHDNRDYRVSDHPTIRLTKPGTYTLRMYTLDTSLYCRAEYFDTTITYESGVLYYEQNPTAFVCDAGGETKGFVFCKSAGGMAPYTYSLYNADNVLLGTNHDGEFLNLPGVHQDDRLTLYVSDSCGWYSIDSSIVMRDFKSSIVVWYNDETGDHQTSGPSTALKAVTKCEGTEITVNVSSINALFTYRWYNKSGSFEVYTSEAKVLIPRNAGADTYYVNVEFTECSAGFTDSIYVDVIHVPVVTITPSSTMVCPGETVQLAFSATNPNGSPTGNYVIGRENNSVVTFMNYSDLQGHEISYTATSPNRFWVHSVSDETCTYTIPEDTVLISLRGMTSSCDVTVNSDTICYGGDITFSAASPTLGSAYTVKWYDSPTQDNLLEEKYIATSGETSTFTLSGLTADSSLYVTVVDELHCETYTGTVQRWLNMGDSTSVHMSCGENVRLFDSGGSAQYYGPGEKDTITFSSADLNDRITLSFNDFNLIGNDKLYVYSGPIAHTDSLIVTLGGNDIPSVISSNSNALTLRFRSDLTDQADGWDAVVGCSALPAEAKAYVLDDFEVTLSATPSLPARYGHSLAVTATAHGGHGTNYLYVWEESVDSLTWTPLANNTDDTTNTYNISALTESKYLRVTVTDASATPCPGNASEGLYLEVADIALSLTLTSAANDICQETFAMSANVTNEGGETATGVTVKPNLPAGMVLVNPADTIITIGNVGAGATVSQTFNVRNEVYVTTNTVQNIQAQIWTCNQGDGESVFQNWDWTRTPLENDEAEYQVTIRPSMDAALLPGVTVAPVNVCYGEDATLVATPTISEPVYYTWYADAALTNVVSTTNTYMAQQVTDPRTYYVLAYNDQYCPAAAAVNHEIKLQYAVTDTLLMRNGTVQVGNNDHIRFYDDGGPNGPSTATSYTLLFTSADGSPLEIYFEGSQNFNTGALTIYDGSSVMGINLTATAQIADGSAFTASSGMMLVKYNSYNNYYSGFSAHVFTVTRPAVAEAVASSRIGEAQTITPANAVVCYGDDATLYATSTIDAPQTFTWFAPDLFTVVRTETVYNAGDQSSYTVPAPQREETYYVTVTGNGGCPLVPLMHNNYKELRFGEDYSNENQSLSVSDSVCLYDAGGKDGGYMADCGKTSPFRFTGPEGSRIRLHINSLDMANDGNGYVSICLYDGNGNNNCFSLSSNNGVVQDTDFVSMNNRMEVYFYPGCNNNYYSGLDAYVYAVMPQDSDNFAKARIAFKTPTITDVNVTGSGEFCYGAQASLMASVEGNTTDAMRYVWYDSEYNVVKQETDVTSTYQPVVTSAETYYVNASATDQCPVLPPGYVTVLLNEASNGGVRTFAAGEAVHFYDEGGPDGNYSTYNNGGGVNGWTYTFKAPAGKRVKMELYNFHGSCNENLSIYDGTQLNHQNAWGYSCNQDGLNQTFYAQSGTMTVRWWNWTTSVNSEQIGWDALVGVEDGTGQMRVHEMMMDSVKVALKAPISPSNITTEDLTACYGTNGYLQASAPTLTGDQMFTWYGPDRMEPIYTETVSEGGTSQLPVQVLRNETYYATVSNADNCAVMGTIRNNYREVLLNTGETTSLAPEDSVCLYDIGGKNGDYTANCHGYSEEFHGPAGSRIRLHISSLQMDNNNSGHIQVYWHNANGNNESQTLYGTQADVDFESADNYMRVFFSTGCDGNTYPGLDAYIYAIAPLSETLFASADVTLKTSTSPSSITTEGLTACYGTNGYLQASAPSLTGDQTFKWYGPDLREPIYRETVSEGGTSRLPVQVLGNETYYVTVFNADNCEVMEAIRDNYREVRMISNSSITLSASDSVCLYDMGGKNDDYTANCRSYDTYFNGPTGSKVRLHISSLQLDNNSSGYIQLSWHNANGNEEYQTLYGTQTDLDFESEDNYMRVYFYTGCDGNTYPGLDAYIYAVAPHDATEFASVMVSPKTVNTTLINTQDAVVCYGDDAVLQATAQVGPVPTYHWYGPDLFTMVYEETAHTSTYTVIHPETEGTYYVSVTSDTTCPFVTQIHDNYQEFLFDNTNDGDRSIGINDSVCIYDAEGKNGSCQANGNWYSGVTFVGPAGSHIRLHVNSMDGQPGNGRLEIGVYDNFGQQHNSSIYCYDGGSLTDTDFVSMSNRMYVMYYPGSDYNTYSGLDAYLYAVSPIDTANFAKVQMTFQTPSLSQVSVTGSGAYCYGTEASLEASVAGNSDDLRYVWYDKYYNIVKQETVVTSTYQPLVTSAATYYVNASVMDQCPVLPPDYVTVLMNEASNGRVRNLAEGEAVNFYDEGGPDGNYSTYNDNNGGWTYTFKAPAGKQVKMELYNFRGSCNENLVIYDGTPSNNQNSWSYSCNQEGLNKTLYAESGTMTVYWRNWTTSSSSNQVGWDALVGVEDGTGQMSVHEVTMDSAKVMLKTVNTTLINTQDAVVCYGEDAVLQATAQVGPVPTYRWYAPDLFTMVHEETAHTSTYTVSSPETEDTYYVSVMSDTMCPFITPIHDNYREFLFDGTGSGERSIGVNDSVCLYDAGGRDGSCQANGNWYSGFTFVGPAGSHIRLHVNSMDGQPGSGRLDVSVYDDLGQPQYSYMHCYDGTVTDTDFVSMSNRIYVMYYPGSDNNTYSGLDAYLYAEPPIDTANFAKVQVTFQTPTFTQVNVTGSGAYCYGTQATFDASVTGNSDELRYVWYDKYYNIVKQETAVTSTYQTLVTREATYYVNASAMDQCPILEPGYVTVLMDEASNGGIKTLVEGEAVYFYDEGGPDGNYSTYNSNSNGWMYTFQAPAGKRVKMELYNFHGSCNENLEIYDGTPSNYRNFWSYSCNREGLNETLYAESGTMTVRWRNYTTSSSSNQIGWDALVGVEDEMGQMSVHEVTMDSAKVTLKTVNTTLISTQDAVVCYGDDAVLQATAQVGPVPTYRWYGPDLFTIVHEETAHTSTYTAPHPETEETYYVSVTSDTTCPFLTPIHDNYREFLFDGTHSGDRSIGINDSVCLYDAGGRDGSCQANGNWYSGITFVGPAGSRMRLHVNSMDGQRGNGRLEVRVYDDMGREQNSSIYSHNDPVTDIDFVSMNNRIYVMYYPGSDDNTYSGLDAYLYAISPIDTATFAKARVTFQTPTFTQVNVTGSGAYCYGAQATFDASVTGNSDDLRYVWYDKYYNIAKQETAVTSIYQPLVTSAATYYVNASAMGQCPILPPDYVTVLMNEASNGKVRNLAEGEAVHFYDEGGPDGNYITYNDNNGGWMYTFQAPADKRVKMELYNFHGNCNENLEIYDGTPSNYRNFWSYSCNREGLNETLYAESGTMTVRWRNYTTSSSSNQIGWDALVGVEDGMGQMSVHEGMMDSVKVTLIPPVSPSLITTQGDDVCFGSEATLTASADPQEAAFPQIYTWYSPDRMTVLLRDTIYSGQSQYTFTPEQEDTYYVAVSGEGDCPIVEAIHDQYGNDIWFTSNSNGNNDKLLTENNIYRIYDDGGPNGEYSSTSANNSFSSYEYFNTNVENSQIKIHFDTIALADSKARLTIQRAEGNWYTVFDLRGPKFIADTDIVVDVTRIQISFYKDNNTSSTAGGFAGYVHAITPHSLDELAEVSVTFTQPTINSNISVTDGEVCFGDEVELVATSTGISSPQVFAWFDADYNLLKSDTVSGGQSTFSSPVLNNTIYYVNATEQGGCPVLPPHYGSIFLNANTNGGSYTLAEGEAVLFYDEGGPDGNYSTYVPYENAWTYTFEAPAGKQVTVIVSNRSTSNAELMVYDGTVDYYNNYHYCYGGNTYVSTTGKMTFRWYTNNPMYSNPGWNIQVGVKDANDQMIIGDFGLASANVSVKQPTTGLDLMVSDATVCYGSEAYLTAQATDQTQSLLGYPQYFTWYAPDGHTLLLKDTVDGATKTYSEFTAPGYYQYQDQNYYVSVGNQDNCPAVLATINNVSIVHLTSSVHNQTTLLAPGDAVKFYDAEEGYTSYYNQTSDYTHTFQTLQGNLLVKFIGANGNTRIASGDTLYIYDAATADDASIIGKVSYFEDGDDYSALSFASTGKYLTFRFESFSSWETGWEALIVPVNLQADMDTAKVSITISSVPETAITMYSDTVCLGQVAEVSASADLEYPQYYVWYDSEMQELLRDTLHNASESPSVLSLPAHFADASYYALIYSDTVSCVMNTNGLQRAYTELPLTGSMSGVETQLSPSDSIRIFTPTAINRTGSDDYHFDYYFTSESGVIQIHFDELVLNDYGIRMELEDEATDIEYVEYEAGIYHDVTVTSLRNHLHMQFSREVGRTFSFDATVINIATSNEVLSKMERADVIMKVASATANVTATNDTVCYGSPALLTASSSDPAFPQIYTWYDSDVNEILLSDTITSGVSSLYIPGQLGAATYYVFMNNENNPCPLTVVDRHDNFREYLFTEEMNNATLFVGAVDSLVLYDNGGKDGDYSIVVDENTHFNIIKLQTYPGSIIHVEIPTLETDEEYSFFAIAEPDENGNLDFEDDDNVILLTGQMSDFSYNSQTNILYVGWIYYGTDQASTPSGYEVVLTSIMHPENQLTKAKVEMSNLPNMNTLALTADPNETTICQGDDVELTATSTLTDQPQYFVWYNSDFTSVLAADTVQLGNEGHATISDLTQDTLIYVAVGTDEMCPAYPMDHKILVQELYLTAPVSGDTTILSLIDSVLFYDEGGPSNNYNSENVIWYHTFKASNPDAHVIIHFKDINLDTKCSSDNWLVVVQGPLDFEDRDNNDFLHEPFQGTHSDVTLVSDGDSLTVVWGSKCWDSQRRGWEAYVFTDETVNVGMDAFDTTEVTVNPSYHYTVYDSVCASTTQLYDVDKFHGIDISVPGDYTIDSVYSTNLGCDSIYSLQLHVRSNPVIGDNATVTDVACNGGSTGIIDMSTATTTGGEAPFTYTLFQNGTQVASFSDLIAGTYKVVAKDVHGCYSDSTTIDIDEPDTLHVVNCPTVSATYQVLPGETFVTVELDDPTFAPALNNARVTERQGKADNNLYSVGTYTITYVVENDCNEEDTCSVTFTVENADDVPPCIGCDSTATDPTDPNAGVNCASIGNQNVQPNSGTTYVHGDNSWNITATDDNVEVTLSYKLFGATTAVTAPNTTLNGQVFNEGETTVRWIAEDAAGNADSCEFTVTVDGTAPCIGCDSTATNPTDPTAGVSCASIGAQNVQPNSGTTYVHGDNSWNITATDNNGEVTLSYKLFGATTAVTAPNTTLNGQVFNEGVTTVRWIAEDAAGNTDSCEFTVTVEVYDPLAVTLTVDSVTCYGANDGAAVVAITGGKTGSPRYTYTVTGVNTGYTNNNTTDDNISLTDLAPDRYTVHIEDLQGSILDTAFNIGQPDTLVVTVTVPSASCPNFASYDVSLTTTGGNGGNQYEWGDDATDANATSTVVARVLDTDCGYVYTAAAKVTDRKGCVATDTVSFTVVDTVKPNAEMPADITLCRNSTTGAIEAPTSVTGEPANLGDNCTNVDALTVTSIDADTTGTDSEPRVIHREWHVTDLCGNDSVKIQNITIRPSVLTPGNIEFTCPDATITLKYGACDTLLELSHTLVNNMSSMTVTLDSTGIPGSHRYNVENSPYTITWRVTDECGTFMEYQQTVTVNYPPCGNDYWVKDGDDIAYPTVRVGCNCWTARNARSTKYTDGTPITPAPMQYPGTEQHPEDTIYGKLYTYNAATRVPLVRSIPAQVQGICPDGWHIPDDEDFVDLMAHWEGEELNATEHWLTPGTNISGFTMEPGGRFNAELNRYEYLLVRGYLWSYTPGATTIVHACEFGSACGTVEIIPATMPTGFSVRCVHDAE